MNVFSSTLYCIDGILFCTAENASDYTIIYNSSVQAASKNQLGTPLDGKTVAAIINLNREP